MQRRGDGPPSGRPRGPRAYAAIALAVAATAALAGFLTITVALPGTYATAVGARLTPASDAGILAMLGIALTLAGVLIGRGGRD